MEECKVKTEVWCLLLFRCGRSTSHRCIGPQIYNLPFKTVICLWKQVFEVGHILEVRSKDKSAINAPLLYSTGPQVGNTWVIKWGWDFRRQQETVEPQSRVQHQDWYNTHETQPQAVWHHTRNSASDRFSASYLRAGTVLYATYYCL